MTVIAIEDVEGRAKTRKRVLDTGLIRFGDLSASCILRNLSETGAALDVGSQSSIPDQFTLIVVRNKKIYSCNVIWRKGTRIGVSFC